MSIKGCFYNIKDGGGRVDHRIYLLCSNKIAS